MVLWESFHLSVNITVDQMTLDGGLISFSCVSINEKSLLIYVNPKYSVKSARQQMYTLAAI
jgi:hypothetical protein